MCPLCLPSTSTVECNLSVCGGQGGRAGKTWERVCVCVHRRVRACSLMTRDQTWRKRKGAEEPACWHLGKQKHWLSPMRVEAVPGGATSSTSRGGPQDRKLAAL